MHDSNPGSLEPNLQQTECPLTNRLSYRGSSKNLNSIARPYDQRAFSPLNPTAVWLSHLALAIYMFVVVNFVALAQTSGFRIGRKQIVFLCWMQDSNPGSLEPYLQQTECHLTNRLSLPRIKQKLQLNSPSLWSASIQPTRPPTAGWYK